MAQSVDLSALNTNLGEYCREHNNMLFSSMLLGMNEVFKRQGITLMTDVTDETPLVQLFSKGLVQDGRDKDFTPIDDVVGFDSRTIKTQEFKVDFKIEPWKFEKTWLAHNQMLMANARALKAPFTEEDTIPFYQYIVEKVLEQLGEELRIATFKGVKAVAPVAGATTQWIDGFFKLLSDGKTAGDIPVVTLGAITTANVVSKIETMADAVSKEYAYRDGTIHVPFQVYRMYLKADPSAVGRELRFDEGTELSQDRAVYVRGTKIQIVPNYEATFGATSQIFYTAANNLYVAVDDMMKNTNIRFQQFDRIIKMMIDGRLGVQYAMDSKNQAGVTPLLVSEAF